LRTADTRRARQTILDLRAAGVVERRDMNRRFWQGVAALKARGRISLADCFCIALAQELGADVVTSDRREFGPIASLGIVSVRFIR
jgi:predicted nucleic acid-binding protein